MILVNLYLKKKGKKWSHCFIFVWTKLTLARWAQKWHPALRWSPVLNNKRNLWRFFIHYYRLGELFTKEFLTISIPSFFSNPNSSGLVKLHVCLYRTKIFSRISWPISIKLGTNHPWVKKILNCSNKGPGLLSVRIWVKMDPPHPLVCCKRRLNDFGWDRKNRDPVSKQVWHDKDSSLLKGRERRA
jgi:hypothetical protein